MTINRLPRDLQCSGNLGDLIIRSHQSGVQFDRPDRSGPGGLHVMLFSFSHLRGQRGHQLGGHRQRVVTGMDQLAKSIGQLPDISRPVIAQQQVEKFCPQRCLGRGATKSRQQRLFALALAYLQQKCPGQFAEVLTMIAQGL